MQFYIVNDFDKPDERHVAQIVNTKNELEYIHYDLQDWCKQQGGKLQLNESSYATLEDFGFDVVIKEGMAYFKKTRESVAKYCGGKSRPWQGASKFILKVKSMEE